MLIGMIDRIESIDDLVQLFRTGSLAGILGADVYFVGGGVRDLLSGRKCSDFDFALGSRQEETPRYFADATGGTFFWLDKARKQSRVVVKVPNSTRTFDFAPLRGAIQEDLALRDFTINAMGIHLERSKRDIIDPLGGCEDIKRCQIKACSSGCFRDDPLRLLRAVRFAVTFGYTIEKETWSAIAEHAYLLVEVAKERVRDELFKILAAPDIRSSLQILRACGLLEKVFPSISDAGADMDAGIHAAQAVEDLAAELNKGDCGLREYLSSSSEAGVTVLSLLKLAAFMKPAIEFSEIVHVVDDIRLGKTTKRVVQLLLGDLRQPFSLLSSNPTERAAYRLFKDRKAGPEIVIAALAEEACHRELAERLIGYYFRGFKTQELLSGREIMHNFGLEPGTRLGEAIALLRSAEASGQVNSKAEALAFLGKKLLTKVRS